MALDASKCKALAVLALQLHAWTEAERSYSVGQQWEVGKLVLCWANWEEEVRASRVQQQCNSTG